MRKKDPDELIKFEHYEKPWESPLEWSERRWSAEKEQTPHFEFPNFLYDGGRITGNALCQDKGTGKLYEGLSESQTVENGFTPLSLSQRQSMVGALVEPNNMVYTQSMLDSGIGLYSYPATGTNEKTNVYIGCASDIDKNAVHTNVSTGSFRNGLLSKETFDHEYFIRKFPVNKVDMWRLNRGVRFDNNGSLVFRNGVVIPYTFSTTMTPREYSMRNFRTIYFMDYSDLYDYYYFRSYSPEDMRRIIKHYSQE